MGLCDGFNQLSTQTFCDRDFVEKVLICLAQTSDTNKVSNQTGLVQKQCFSRKSFRNP